MKTYLYIAAVAALLLGFTACTKSSDEINLKPGAEEKLVEVVLGADFASTKTTMASNGDVLWSSNDKIKVQIGGNAYDFDLKTGSGTISATFSAVVPESDAAILKGEAQGTVTAYYPTSGAEVPSTQTYAEGTFADGMNPMTATFASGTLTFTNNAAVVRVQSVSAAATSAVLSYTVNSTDYSVSMALTAGETAKDLYFVVVPGAKFFNLSIDSATAVQYEASESTAAGSRYNIICPAAKIGSKSYGSLEDAFDAVQEGETIELQSDCSLSTSETIEKSITLSLGTHTLTAACAGYLFDLKTKDAGKTFKITGTDADNCGHIISNGASGHNGIAVITGQPVTFIMEAVKVHGATEEAAYVGVANDNATSLIADQTDSKEDVINLTNCTINTTSVILGGNQTHNAAASLNISGGSYTGAKGFRFEGAVKSVVDGATITVDQGIALYPYSDTDLKNSFVIDNATGNTNHDAISIGGEGKVLTIDNTTVNTVSKTAVAAEHLGKVVINSGSFKSTLSSIGAVLRANTSGGQIVVNGGAFDGSSAKYAIFSNTYAGSAPDDPAGVKIYGGTFTGGNSGFGDVSSDNATIDIYGGIFMSAVELKTDGTQHIWLNQENTAVFESTVNNSCGKIIYAGTFKGAVTTGNNTLQGGTYYVKPDDSKCVSGYILASQGTSPETWNVIEKPATEVSSESALRTAISNASAGDMIKLTADITLANVLSIDKEIIINLNEKTLTGAQVTGPITVAASANVTFKNGNIKDAGYTSSGGCVDVSGKATLENVNIESSCVPVRGIASTTDLTIKSGTYKAKRNVGTSSDQINNRCYCAPVCIMNGAKVNIEGGTFTGAFYACSIFSSGGTLNISGGTFNKGAAQTEANEGGGLAYAFLNDGANSATGTITIAGNPTIHGSFRGRVNNQAGHPGVLNISGGTFDSDCELFNFNSSNVHLTGYTITANGECPDKGYSKTTGNGKRWTLTKNN